MLVFKDFKRAVVFLSIFFLLACQGGENQTNIELIQDMMQGPQIKAQEGSLNGKMLMRVPPKATIPRGFKPYPYDKFNIKAADSLKSPKSSLTFDELIFFQDTGREKFEIYCGVCHGSTGKGDSLVAAKMLKKPPNLTQARFVSYTDGRLYNIVTNGWGLMGGYLSQITSEKDRWAVVDYVRLLQQGGD